LSAIIPLLELINEEDVDYILSKENRYSWFQNLSDRPIKLKTSTIGEDGKIIQLGAKENENKSLKAKIKRLLRLNK
jgi:hypothetical protein